MKQKILHLLRLTFIFCIAQLSTNCAVEELGTRQEISKTTNIEEAKNWFQQYESTTEFKPTFNSLVYDWSNSKVETLENNLNTVVVPVYENSQDASYNGKKLLLLYPVPNSTNFETTLYELLPTSKSVEKLDIFNPTNNFDGYIVVWNLEKGFVESTKFENSVRKATFSGYELPTRRKTDSFGKATPDPPPPSYCLGDLILCNDYKNGGGGYSGTGYVYYVNSWGSAAGDYTGSYFSSHGSGGGGGGGGSSTTTPPPTDDDTPPSCESFNFTTKPGTIWQEAAVKNITFKVVLISEAGLEILHVVSYPQPILFGAPTNILVGNTNITAGIAANTSAQVLRKTMDEVEARYGRTRVSDLVLDQYFRTRLVENYAFSIPGGRVQFNSTTNLPATTYKTTRVYSDDCR